MRRFLHLLRYIKLLKRNKKVLEDSRINNNPNPFGIQYDWIYRLYTVLNLPFEDEEFIKKYGFQDTKNVYYVENKVKLHIIEINKYLFDLGILEYVTLDINNIQQIDEYNVRIVLKFKYLDLKFWARFFIISIPIIISAGILYLFL